MRPEEDHGTIVALACHEPEETCFCKVFGIDAAEPVADVSTWLIGEDLYWESAYRKRRSAHESCCRPAHRGRRRGTRLLRKKKEAIHNIIEQLPYTHLSLEGWNGDVTMEKFDSPLWG